MEYRSHVSVLLLMGMCLMFGRTYGNRLFFKRNPNMTHSNMTHSNMTHSNMTHSNMTHSNMTHSNMTHSNMTHSNMTHSNMPHPNATRPINDTNPASANATAPVSVPPPIAANFTAEELKSDLSRDRCSAELCVSEPPSCNPASNKSACTFLSAKQEANSTFSFALSRESDGYIGATLTPLSSRLSKAVAQATTYICARGPRNKVKMITGRRFNGKVIRETLRVNRVKGGIFGKRIVCTFSATLPDSTARAAATTFTLSFQSGAYNPTSDTIETTVTHIRATDVDLSVTSQNVTNEITSNSTNATTAAAPIVTANSTTTNSTVTVSAATNSTVTAVNGTSTATNSTASNSTATTGSTGGAIPLERSMSQAVLIVLGLLSLLWL